MKRKDDIIKILDDLLKEKESLNEIEKIEIEKYISELVETNKKLQKNEFHITVFGEVGTGKSSLLNSLIEEDAFEISARHGETQSLIKKEWNEKINDFKLVLIDSPGINEVDGSHREDLAYKAASKSDLILFVTDSDLNEVECSFLKLLVEMKKVIFLILNKTDILKEQEKKEILISIKNKIKNKNFNTIKKIIETSASPLYLDKPDLTILKDEIFNIIRKEGINLNVLNSVLFINNVSDKILKKKIEYREELLNQIIEKYAKIKGVVVALNPIVFADILSGAVIDIYMIMKIGDLYGIKMTFIDAKNLLLEISKYLVMFVGIEYLTDLFSGILKTATFGISIVATGLIQGLFSIYMSVINR